VTLSHASGHLIGRACDHHGGESVGLGCRGNQGDGIVDLLRLGMRWDGPTERQVDLANHYGVDSSKHEQISFTDSNPSTVSIITMQSTFAINSVGIP
jgi:hypothetical protein